jgi:hypothetical protein
MLVPNKSKNLQKKVTKIEKVHPNVMRIKYADNSWKRVNRTIGESDKDDKTSYINNIPTQNLTSNSPSVAKQFTPDWQHIKKDFFKLKPASINPVLAAKNVTDRKAKFVADPFLFMKK